MALQQRKWSFQREIRNHIEKATMHNVIGKPFVPNSIQHLKCLRRLTETGVDWCEKHMSQRRKQYFESIKKRLSLSGLIRYLWIKSERIPGRDDRVLWNRRSPHVHCGGFGAIQSSEEIIQSLISLNPYRQTVVWPFDNEDLSSGGKTPIGFTTRRYDDSHYILSSNNCTERSYQECQSGFRASGIYSPNVVFVIDFCIN
jgi:hypothetical protein